jgi:hypothetical protein
MATLMPSLSSDDEQDPANEDSSDEEEEENEVDESFQFGGILVS